MRQAQRWGVACVGLLVGLGVLGIGGGYTAENEDKEVKLPAVFQAAGTTAEAIQSTVDAFRAALGEPNNANDPGPLPEGRREINWDGGGADETTTPPVTPFDVFLSTRGAQFTSPATGLTQAPPAGGPQGGLAALFNNPTYRDIFSTFSPLRLFAPVGSNFVDGQFFIPGTNGEARATVRGFGAVFTDVDRPAGSLSGDHLRDLLPSTLITYFDADGQELFTGVVPASPGDGSLSFFGAVFEDARIARIISGNAAPGPDDDKQHDIVVMDDFLYGEPQPHLLQRPYDRTGQQPSNSSKQHEKLAAALRAVKSQIVALKEALDKLCAPPIAMASFARPMRMGASMSVSTAARSR